MGMVDLGHTEGQRIDPQKETDQANTDIVTSMLPCRP